MIVRHFICAAGHTFEGWFADQGALREQRGDGLLVCPVCSSAEVHERRDPGDGQAVPASDNHDTALQYALLTTAHVEDVDAVYADGRLSLSLNDRAIKTSKTH